MGKSSLWERQDVAEIIYLGLRPEQPILFMAHVMYRVHGY